MSLTRESFVEELSLDNLFQKIMVERQKIVQATGLSKVENIRCGKEE